MKYVNKRMVIVLNQMSVKLAGGVKASGNSIREGCNLGFIDRIHVNAYFGQTLYPTIFDQAAAYMFYIVKNHVFLDGNKRTGLLAAVTFLQWNGVSLKPFDEDAVFDFVIAVAGGPNKPDTEIPRIAAWLRELAGEGEVAAVASPGT